ncbi:MAG: hypothetical protein DWP92_10885, partial [Armatimonadetes bacterium]
RVRLHLQANDAWDETWEQEVADAASAMVEDAVDEAEAIEPLKGDEIFSAMFAQPTAPLIDQRAMLGRDG